MMMVKHETMEQYIKIFNCLQEGIIVIDQESGENKTFFKNDVMSCLLQDGTQHEASMDHQFLGQKHSINVQEESSDLIKYSIENVLALSNKSLA